MHIAASDTDGSASLGRSKRTHRRCSAIAGERRGNSDSRHDGGRTPLSWAGTNEHDGVFELLPINDGVDTSVSVILADFQRIVQSRMGASRKAAVHAHAG